MPSRFVRRGLLTAAILGGLCATHQVLPARTADAATIGRIAGRVGPFPQAEGLAPIRVQAVELFTHDAPRPSAVATPNNAGEFTFEAVPPGRIVLHPVLVDSQGGNASNPSALGAPAIVRAGETLKVDLFGKGRPVTGRLEFPSHVAPDDCRVELLYVAPPSRTLTDRSGRSTPASHAYSLLTLKKLTSPVAPDGRFRIEAVRAGNYRLHVTRTVDGKSLRMLPNRRGLEPDHLPERVTIWLMSDEESEKPQDLGTSAWEER